MRNRLLPCLISILFLIFQTANAQTCTLPVNGGTITSTQNNVCTNTFYYVTASGISSGDGITYQWEKSPDNINWTPIQAANLPTLYPFQTSSTWYRLVTTCSAGGFAYSNSI